MEKEQWRSDAWLCKRIYSARFCKFLQPHSQSREMKWTGRWESSKLETRMNQVKMVRDCRVSCILCWGHFWNTFYGSGWVRSWGKAERDRQTDKESGAEVLWILVRRRQRPGSVRAMRSWEDKAGYRVTRDSCSPSPLWCGQGMGTYPGTLASLFSLYKPQKQCNPWIMEKRLHLPLGKSLYSWI